MAPFRSRSAAADEPIDPHAGHQRPKSIAELPIPPLEADPAFAAHMLQRNAFTRCREDREHELEKLAIQAHLRTLSTGLPETERRLRARLEVLTATKGTPVSPAVSAEAATPAIERGLRLVAGETIAPEPDRAAMIVRLRSEIETLTDALRDANSAMDTIRSERSAVINQSLIPRQHSILKAKYEAAMSLAAAVSAERSLIAELLLQGYEHYPDILKSPPLDPAARLGAIAEWDSPISTFRRTLETLKVI
jgi:hypothetical protein